MLAKMRKAVGALLGGVTGAAVVGAFQLFDVSVPESLALAIAGLCAVLGTYLAPPNKTT